MLNTFILLILVFLVSADDAYIPETYFSDVNERILNGRNAVAGQLPYQSLLYMTNSDGNHSFCGGSLINTKTILTAAHCCVDISSTLVLLGLLNVLNANDTGVQKFNVSSSSFSIHEDYNPQTIANDICLLHLPKPAVINSNVSTVDIPAELDSNPQQFDFKIATISGWGQTNNFEGIHSRLQWSRVRMQPHIVCKLAYTFINEVTDSQLCSGKIPYSGPCHGDSGGPLTIINTSTNKPVEVGLVSWGVGGCTSFLPVVYTYVPAFVEWINSHLK